MNQQFTLIWVIFVGCFYTQSFFHLSDVGDLSVKVLVITCRMFINSATQVWFHRLQGSCFNVVVKLAIDLVRFD